MPVKKIQLNDSSMGLSIIFNSFLLYSVFDATRVFTESTLLDSPYMVSYYSNNRMSISHRLSVIGTQNVFSYLLSLGPNCEKRKCTK